MDFYAAPELKAGRCGLRKGARLDMREIDRETAGKECERMNREIMQYVEEYQNVRNMMYVVTASILGLNSAFLNNYRLFLLPLAVILPSYMIFYDYWRCVTRDSTYLRVFYPDFYPWEYRNLQKSKLLDRYQIAEDGRSVLERDRPLDRVFAFTDEGSHIQQFPYIVCAAACIILFASGAFSVSWDNFHADPVDASQMAIQADGAWTVTLEDGTQMTMEISSDSDETETDPMGKYFTAVLDAVLLLLSSLASFVIFRKFWEVDREPFMKIWEAVRDRES